MLLLHPTSIQDNAARGVITFTVIAHNQIPHWGITQHPYFGHSSALSQTCNFLYSIRGRSIKLPSFCHSRVEWSKHLPGNGSLGLGLTLPGHTVRFHGDRESPQQQSEPGLRRDTSRHLHLLLPISNVNTLALIISSCIGNVTRTGSSREIYPIEFSSSAFLTESQNDLGWKGSQPDTRRGVLEPLLPVSGGQNTWVERNKPQRPSLVRGVPTTAKLTQGSRRSGSSAPQLSTPHLSRQITTC